MTATDASAAVWGPLIALLLFAAFYVWTSLSLAAVFRKSGAEQWKAWVPVLNLVVLVQLGGLSPWLLLVGLLPGLGTIALLVVLGVAIYRINLAFGYGAGLTVLGVVLIPAWASVVGFGSARWVGREPDAGPRRTPAPTAPPALPSLPPFRAPADPAAYGAPVAPPPTRVEPGDTAGPPAYGAFAPAPFASEPAPPPPAFPPATPGAPAPAARAPMDPGPGLHPASAGEEPPPPPSWTPPVGGWTPPPLPQDPAGEDRDAAGERAWPDEPSGVASPYGPARSRRTDSTDDSVHSDEALAAGSAWAGLDISDFTGEVTGAIPGAPAPISAVSSRMPPVPDSGADATQGRSPYTPERDGDEGADGGEHARPSVTHVPAPGGSADATDPWVPGRSPVSDHDAFPESSAPVSAVAGAPSAGGPRSARTSVSAFHGRPEIPENEFEHTVIARRRRTHWSLVPPTGDAIAISAETVILGRKPSPDPEYPGAQLISIQDGTVSKTHARLQLRDDRWYVTDLDSTNGVLFATLMGTEVEAPRGVEVEAGDRFLLGDAEIRLQRSDT